MTQHCLICARRLFQIVLLSWLAMLVPISIVAQSQPAALRVAVVGLVHDHAMGLFPNLATRTDVQLVGIAEPDTSLWAKYGKEFSLADSLFYKNGDEMVAKTHPQA